MLSMMFRYIFTCICFASTLFF